MPRSRLPALALGAVVLALYLGQAAHFRHYVNDDAYITYRYSRSIALGRGPYFNPGEHVEGYSNFLWMLLHVPVAALGAERTVPAAAKVLGTASGLACLVLLLAWPRAWLGKNESGFSGVVAAGLVAASPAFALNSQSGLETTFYASLVTLGVFLGVRGARRERWSGAGLAFAAALLTRPEGIAAVALYGLAQAISLWMTAGRSVRRLVQSPALRHLVIDAVIAILVLGLHIAWRMHTYDGEIFPNTYQAKAAGFWALSPLGYILDGLSMPFLGIFGLGAGILGWLLHRGLRAPALPVLVVGVGGASLPLVLGSDWMLGSRLVVPYLPLAAIVVASGWERGATWAAQRLRLKLLVYAPLVLVVGAWLWQSSHRRDLHDETLLRARGYETGHRALAEWLRGGAARPGDTVALMDVGLVGYLCMDQRILDVSGLTDRTIARSPGPFLEKSYDPAYVLDQKPAFIVLVITADADPDQPIPGGTGVAPWTTMEARIAQHPDFAASYRHPRAPTGAAWTDRLAAVLGAERVFEHRHPGKHYLLTVYRRR